MTFRNVSVLAVASALASTVAPAGAAPRLPYTTTIHCGEISTAILTLGQAAAMCESGRDAIPAFATIGAYQGYYEVDGRAGCDYECLRPTYQAMKRSGQMRPLISGMRVTVLSVMRDPADKRYKICRVKAPSGTWYVICDALTDYRADAHDARRAVSYAATSDPPRTTASANERPKMCSVPYDPALARLSPRGRQYRRDIADGYTMEKAWATRSHRRQARRWGIHAGAW